MAATRSSPPPLNLHGQCHSWVAPLPLNIHMTVTVHLAFRPQLVVSHKRVLRTQGQVCRAAFTPRVLFLQTYRKQERGEINGLITQMRSHERLCVLGQREGRTAAQGWAPEPVASTKKVSLVHTRVCSSHAPSGLWGIF